MGFGCFVRKKAGFGGEKWSVGVVCEEKSGILRGKSGISVKEKWDFGVL